MTEPDTTSTTISVAECHQQVVLSKFGLSQLVIDLALLAELGGVSINGFTSDSISKTYALLFKYLFEDSKVKREKKDAEVDGLVMEIIASMVDFDALTLSLKQTGKALLEEDDSNIPESVRQSITINKADLVAMESEKLACLFDKFVDLVCTRLYDSDTKPAEVILAIPSEEKLTVAKEDLAALTAKGDAKAIGKFFTNAETINMLSNPSDFAIQNMDMSTLAVTSGAGLIESVAGAHTFIRSLLNYKVAEAFNETVTKFDSGKSVKLNASYAEESEQKRVKYRCFLNFGKGLSEYLQACPNVDINTDEAESIDQVEAMLTNVLPYLEAKNAHFQPKPAKGCIDYNPGDMKLREMVLTKMNGIFQQFGGVCIDTPIFERKEVLTGKYGEDTKLIYDIADQGGERLALRYDLTVPFARYCATNNVSSIKRFHIGKVYRRDEPQIAKGRFREFYQCDFDIAGQYDTMMPEAEILSLMTTVLGTFEPIIGDFEIIVSHRGVLDGMMSYAGVPSALLRPISSAIDKLDKLPWAEVAKEMTEKGLGPEPIAKLENLVKFSGSISHVVTELRNFENGVLITPTADAEGVDNSPHYVKVVSQALNELELLAERVTDKHIIMSTSLARGLDYYTGLIYEAVLKSAAVGSIAAGGRYDKLIGMFSGKEIPAVGVSFGIERFFRMLDAKCKLEKGDKSGTKSRTLTIDNQAYTVAPHYTEVYVTTMNEVPISHRLEITNMLRKAGIPAECSLKIKTNMKKELSTVQELGIPMMIIVGENEFKQGMCKIKTISANQADDTEISSPISSFVEAVAGLRKETNIKDILFKQL